jgi:hypothetical protein
MEMNWMNFNQSNQDFTSSASYKMISFRSLLSPALVLISLGQACPPWKEPPKFQITNFGYYSWEIWSTPIGPSSWETLVNFTLINTDAVSSVFCQAIKATKGIFPEFSGNQVFSCDVGVSTNFTFDFATAYVKTNETWDCPEGPESKA